MKYVFALFTLVCSMSLVADDAVFAQLSTSITHEGRMNVVYDQIDGLAGVGYSPATGIEIQEDGFYLAVFAPQTIIGKGCTSAWFVVNDVPSPNSNVVYCTQSPQDTNVVVSQGILELQAGDVLRTMVDGLGIAAIFPPDAPQIPSAITTVYKIGD